MKDIKALAQRIIDSGEKDVEAMKELCRAAGLEKDLEKLPDDQEWLWEVAWKAGEKLGAGIDEPINHYYASFRVEARNDDVASEKPHGCEIFSGPDYWEAKKHYNRYSEEVNGVQQAVRIVGIVEKDSLLHINPEEVLKTNKAAESWTQLDEYRERLMAKKRIYFLCISRINRLLEESTMAKTDPRPRGASSPIAAARLAAGLTQAQLGEKIGRPSKTISRWENGSNMPKADALLKIANVLGCSVESLIK